eukprot:scaffold21720_cov58-Phaeocystis_antarctica.AAC.1
MPGELVRRAAERDRPAEGAEARGAAGVTKAGDERGPAEAQRACQAAPPHRLRAPRATGREGERAAWLLRLLRLRLRRGGGVTCGGTWPQCSPGPGDRSGRPCSASHRPRGTWTTCATCGVRG